MLNTDMQLVYEVNPPSSNPTCGPLCFDISPKSFGCDLNSTCRLSNSSDPSQDFLYWVTQFAMSDPKNLDEPGSSKWLSVFARFLFLFYFCFYFINFFYYFFFYCFINFFFSLFFLFFIFFFFLSKI